MRWFANKNFPHPVLFPCSNPANSDYVGSAFQVGCEFNNKVTCLTVSYALSEKSLDKLISKGAAQYATEVHCRDTYLRRLHLTSKRNCSIEFRKGELHQHVEVSSYVVCTKDIADHTSKNLHREFGKNARFKISSGSVLAVSIPKVFWVDLEHEKRIGTIFELVSVENQREEYVVDLDGNKIKIKMNPTNAGLFRSFQSSKKMFPSLLSSVFLTALMEALRQLAEDDGVYENNTWAKVISQKLANKEIVINRQSDFLSIAQRLLKYPVGFMLQQGGTNGE